MASAMMQPVLIGESRTDYRQVVSSVTIGGFRTMDELVLAIDYAGYHPTKSVVQYMDTGKLVLSTMSISFSVDTVTVAELGFPDGAKNAKVFAALKDIGAQKLPPEAGLVYRLEDKNQVDLDRKMMYMDPITDFWDKPAVLCVERYGGIRWLACAAADPDEWSSGSDGWVYGR